MITNERYDFLGVHVTPDVKDALRRESVKTKKSMSRLAYEAVVAKLREAGHKVELMEEEGQAA